MPLLISTGAPALKSKVSISQPFHSRIETVPRFPEAIPSDDLADHWTMRVVATERRGGRAGICKTLSFDAIQHSPRLAYFSLHPIFPIFLRKFSKSHGRTSPAANHTYQLSSSKRSISGVLGHRFFHPAQESSALPVRDRRGRSWDDFCVIERQLCLSVPDLMSCIGYGRIEL